MNLQEWVMKLKEKILGFGLKEWGMLLVVGLCCLVIVFPEKKDEKNVGMNETESNGTTEGKDVEMDYVDRLEERLTNLLSHVENVGEVEVMITVESTTERVVLQDGLRETQQSTETDSAGGSRNSSSTRTEGTTVFAETDGKSSPYVLSETYPAVTGVVVIAAGSGKGTVDLDILNAVQVLFDVPAHKIKIMKMK